MRGRKKDGGKENGYRGVVFEDGGHFDLKENKVV